MSKLKLYEIEAEFMALAQSIIDNGGEVSPEQEELLQINQTNLETKARGYGFIVIDLESEITIIDGELARLTALKKSRSKTIDKLKEMVSNAMSMYGIDKIESPTLKLSFRKSESVEIEDEKYILNEYCTIKTTSTPNKNKIKEAIKSGVDVFGAVLVENKNLQIK
jgi:hypothetical protein